MNKTKIFSLELKIACIVLTTIMIIYTIIMGTMQNNLEAQMIKDFDNLLVNYGYEYDEMFSASDNVDYVKYEDEKRISTIECYINYETKKYEINSCSFIFYQKDSNISEIINEIYPTIDVKQYENEINNIIDNQLYKNEEGYTSINTNDPFDPLNILIFDGSDSSLGEYSIHISIRN